MCRYRYGNPKKKSQFICLRCLRLGIEGIQRKSQREKFHRKELFCIYCQMETKHIEIRHCDWIEEIKEEAARLHIKYYEEQAI